MVRNQESTQIHLRLITAMVHKLMAEGWKVSADHIGFPNGTPEEWNKYIPDICATKGNEKIYIEAETCDSLELKETQEQWIALSSHPKVQFSVIIPAKCVNEAKRIAEKLHITVKDFWNMDIK
jgi:hypothetical protein